jgi:peptide/nickel transport system substrate-binding protein
MAITRRDFLRATALGTVAVAGAGVLSACTATQKASLVNRHSGSPPTGGMLRLGVPGSVADTLDSAAYVSLADFIRGIQLYDTLAELDTNFKVQMALAEEIIADSPLQWTIRLRRGATFHNGKPVSADDVIFSLQRIINPKSPYQGAPGLSMIDLNGMKKLDAQTVRLTLTRPQSYLVEELTQAWNPIVPVGFNPTTAVGSGPFKLESFTPGQQSVFTRNENYWRQPAYAGSLVMTDFVDPNAILNALMGDQIDAAQLGTDQLVVIQNETSLKLFVSQKGNCEPIVMRTDVKPFQDVRVRQALRLLADRQQIVEQVYSGWATLGNDLMCPLDPEYATALPQRMADVDQAKSLLRSAGYPDLQVEIVTADLDTTLAAGAEVYAQQAAAGGVQVNVRKIDTASFFGPGYLKRPFTQDIWGEAPIESYFSISLLPGAGNNETSWNDPEFNSLVGQARAQMDKSKRAEVMFAAQKVLYDRGGYIIPAHVKLVTAYNDRVGGFSASTTDTNYFNYQYRTLWLDS